MSSPLRSWLPFLALILLVGACSSSTELTATGNDDDVSESTESTSSNEADGTPMGDGCRIYFEADGGANNNLFGFGELADGTVIEDRSDAAVTRFVQSCFDRATDAPADHLATAIIALGDPPLQVQMLAEDRTRVINEAGIEWAPPTIDGSTHTFLVVGREWADVYRATSQLGADGTVATTWDLLYQDPS